MGKLPSMEVLRTYLNGLKPDEQKEFADRCETSVGYLRKAISAEQELGESLCIKIERESEGKVKCEDLRPGVDWAYLRGTAKQGNHGGLRRRAAPG